MIEFTEIRIQLVVDESSRVKGYCSLTLNNCLAIRDIRVLEHRDGFLVAMPNRRAVASCERCFKKNPLGSNYCCHCGNEFDESSPVKSKQERPYIDVAHPITQEFRNQLEEAVLNEFFAASKESKGRTGPPVPKFQSHSDRTDKSFGRRLEE